MADSYHYITPRTRQKPICTSPFVTPGSSVTRVSAVTAILLNLKAFLVEAKFNKACQHAEDAAHFTTLELQGRRVEQPALQTPTGLDDAFKQSQQQPATAARHLLYNALITRARII